jgi:poly(hydroxyalkanoate) granule-associated protein
MLKKVKPKAKKASTESASDLSESVLNSSHQIWLAGLGAFSRAQAEGMKVFQTLVRQGVRLEEKTRRAASSTAAAASGAARAKAKEMQQMAGGTWDKLEHVFEHRVERALSKLGVYTQNDVQRLAERVDELSEAVNRLLKATGVKPVAPVEAAEKPARRTKSASGKSGAPAKRRSVGKRAKKTASAAPDAAEEMAAPAAE